MAESILRLKVESQEYDAKLKRAAEGLNRYVENCRKVGGTLEVVEKDTLEFVRAMGQMETTAKTATGKLSEMKRTFQEWGMVYKQMTDAEKQSPVGKALSQSLDQLKGRIQETKRDMQSLEQELNGSKFGQFGSVIDGIGQKIGINANLTELLTSKTALMSAGIGASVAIIGKATEEWTKYNSELAKQDQITTVTTGLKGADSDRMTNQARALTDTYNVDFREAINAANTLMTQFGQTGEQAMSLIRDGMQGMIQGDGPKLLSMIQQYAPAFRDAGVTASQLVAVIQNSEGGIFTDQNMNAIVMGIKNIRLMTKATSDALAQLGIDGQKMSQQLRDGSLTIFDALKQVATQIQGVNSGSQAAGEVMQQVFGRQGAMAGTKLGEAIATLNTNLEETKRQTGEVGDAYNDLYNANVRLNGAIRDCFEYDGWEQMATGIKSSLVSALASVIEKLATIRQFFTGMSANDYLKHMGGSDKVNRMVSMLGNGQGKARNTYNRQVGAFEAYINPRKKYLENLDAWRRGNRSKEVKAEVEWGRNKFGIDDRAIRNSVKAAESQLEEYQKKAEQVFSNVNKKSGEINIDLTGGNKGGNKGGGNKGGKTITEEKDDFVEINGLINMASERVSDLQKRIREAPSESMITELRDQLKDAQAELDRLNGKEVKIQMETGTSIQNDAGMSAYISSIKQQLETADYGTSLYNGLSAQLSDMTTLQNLVGASLKAGLGTALFDVADETGRDFWTRAMEGGVENTDWQTIIDQINEKLKEMKLDPIAINFKTGEVKNQAKEMSKDWNAAASAIQSVGSAMSQIEDPAAKVMGTVAQAIATIALTFSKSLEKTFTPWDWIAAAAAGTATMISTISAIHSATGYAEGGMIKGNSFSGDNLRMPVVGGGMIGVNSGELILNRVQQGVLADALSEPPSSIQGGNPYVSGENIYLGINNYLRRSGRGEIVTTKR